jgi:hypothetical protein
MAQSCVVKGSQGPGAIAHDLQPEVEGHLERSHFVGLEDDLQIHGRVQVFADQEDRAFVVSVTLLQRRVVGKAIARWLPAHAWGGIS